MGQGNVDAKKIEVGSTFEVEITQSGSYSVSITAGDNLFKHIDVSKGCNSQGIWAFAFGSGIQLITMKQSAYVGARF